MKIFKPLYDKVIAWSKHPHAERYLGGVSFVESSFFPIPTALMLAPMVMAQRHRAWRLAAFTTITSVAGGLFGYLIGYFLYDQIGQHILAFYHLEDKFLQMKQWFDEYGIWLVLLAGVTPIPYKLFTITAGVLSMALIPFTLASLVGRASQFFIVAGLVKWGGEKIEPVLDEWMEWIGWGILVVAGAGFLIIKAV